MTMWVEQSVKFQNYSTFYVMQTLKPGKGNTHATVTVSKIYDKYHITHILNI